VHACADVLVQIAEDHDGCLKEYCWLFVTLILVDFFVIWGEIVVSYLEGWLELIVEMRANFVMLERELEGAETCLQEVLGLWSYFDAADALA
jgi:hypothetical protein